LEFQCTALVLFEGMAPIMVPDNPKSNKKEGNKSVSVQENNKFTGLSNQGATCYMNSFLQSLFHTPLFRKVLFSWGYDEGLHGDAKDCIPFQLQKLFANLQLKMENYIDTKDLTYSFQWFGNEGWEQHDLQVTISRKPKSMIWGAGVFKSSF
jgi:ubiquitin carboxyl-terminal hydrolase 47